MCVSKFLLVFVLCMCCPSSVCALVVCIVLSHPYKCVSCRLWQYNCNFLDLSNSFICLESEIDLNHMGNLLIDVTESLYVNCISIALLSSLKQVLFYFTHYGS